MIISDTEAVARLNSPLNLINKMKSSSNVNGRASAMGLFGLNKNGNGSVVIEKKIANPFEVTSKLETVSDKPDISTELIKSETQSNNPSVSDLITNSDRQVKLNLAHDQALNLLNDSVAALATKLDDVKADKLPSVISAASKVVESIRRERSEAAKNGSEREVHYHFYTPVQKPIEAYDVIEVTQ